MNRTQILQYFNENGIWIPGIYMSKHQCQERWKNLGHVSFSIGYRGNHGYTLKEMN